MPHLPDRHDDHDPALIAAFAAGDTTGAEHTSATELVAACTACASLHDDLLAIAAAVHELPALRRTRDYRLTAEQAATLRPTGWRRLLGTFAGPRFRLAAPLGTTMATLGVAGLLLAAVVPSVPLGISTAGRQGQEATGADPYGGGVNITGNGAQPDASDDGATPGASAEASAPAQASASAPPASAAPPAATLAPASAGSGQRPAATPGDRLGSAVPSGAPAASPKALDMPGTPSTASGTWQPLALASAVLFLVGAALVLARLVARRASPA